MMTDTEVWNNFLNAIYLMGGIVVFFFSAFQAWKTIRLVRQRKSLLGAILLLSNVGVTHYPHTKRYSEDDVILVSKLKDVLRQVRNQRVLNTYFTDFHLLMIALTCLLSAAFSIVILLVLKELSYFYIYAVYAASFAFSRDISSRIETTIKEVEKDGVHRIVRLAEVD